MTQQATNQQIFEAVGSLKTEVTSLRRDLARSEATQAESIRQAAVHRGKIHERVDKAVREISAVKEKVATQGEQIETITETLTDEIKPATDDFIRMKHMGIGALGVVGIGAGVIGATIATWFDTFMRMIRS